MKLKPVRLKRDEPINHDYPIAGLDFDDIYVVLGEVGNTDHFVLASYSLSNPRILPGMYELYRFEEVPDDEL